MYKKWLRAFEYKRLSIDKVSSKCPEKGKKENPSKDVWSGGGQRVAE